MYVKYPRTPHLPWSKGATTDDVFTSKQSVAHFASMREVVITEKMDGENTTLYSDYLHARAIVGIEHPSRSWIKALHASIKHDIPTNMRLCGENLYAKHSIHYDNLINYFMIFSIFDDDRCISWDDTVACAHMLNLITVPILYKGPWNYQICKEFDSMALISDKFEGYVVRNSDAFLYDNYADNIAKYVRPHHITTSDHWRNEAMILNKLKD